MPKIAYSPLTIERWQDFEQLFGSHGAGGCWCIFWHLTRAEFSRGCGQVNKNRLHQLVKQGKCPGILIYEDEQPKAWCTVAPREDFSALARSRSLARIDNQPVWSIVCFYIPKEHRGNNLLSLSIKAALQYASESGASILEAYPVETAKKQPPMNVYMGIASIFCQLGFKEVARRSPTHPIFRYQIKPGEIN
jgi:hypothetical protein